MNRLEQAFEDKYRADRRDPMVAEDLARFTDGWSAALSEQQGEALTDRKALEQYANPHNWAFDDQGVRRVWLEPDSSTPSAYDGFDLAKAALSAQQAGTGEPKRCDHFPGQAECDWCRTPKAAPAAVSESTLQLQEALHCLSDVMRAATHALIVMPAGERETKLRSVLSKAHDWYMAETAALSPPPSVGEPTAREPFLKALDIRTAQGWGLAGTACPILYTDEINGEMVGRDDLWIATTAALKTAAHATDGAKPAGGFPFLQKIDTLIASVNEAHHAKSDGWRDGCFAAADAVYEEIKAALAAAPDSQGAPKPVAWTDAQMVMFAGYCMYAVSLRHLSIAERLEHFRKNHPSDGAQAAGQEDAS